MTVYCQACGDEIHHTDLSKQFCRSCLEEDDLCGECNYPVIPRTESPEGFDNKDHVGPYWCPECEEPRYNNAEDLNKREVWVADR